ncbi:MAG: beta-N-acetylhexosaminidase [Pyrinomonadaceae bacterium]
MPLDIVGEISIIPLPVSVKRLGGQFELTADTKIAANDEAGIRAAAVLAEALMRDYGLKLGMTDRLDLPNSIIFSIASPGNDLGDEGYFLRIQPKFVQVIGSERGMFYGIQSLNQLLPMSFDGKATLPAAEIYDIPRFRYRGMHLDVARHFMPIEFVKKFIDLLSRYKYNSFHWHLTDDQGWRIEIKKYPLLTEVGSVRRESMVGKLERPYVGDRTPVSGFYTQEQIREVVAFAKSRYVTVIPEIDMPGHSAAALAAYPQFGCKVGYKYEVKTTWAASANILCPTEQTFQFIADVVDEVADLFPDTPYLHVGGDEVKPDHWRESQYVAALRKSKGLVGETAVQSWFFSQVGSLVRMRGKKVIGWDEILDGRAPTDAVVMSWRGESGGIAAARARLQVIMTPSDFTYFDHPQGDPEFEPLSLGPQITLRKVYDYEPIPQWMPNEDSGYVLGAQGCVWTEFMKEPSRVEYMTFPRALALAEVLWSKKKSKDFDGFLERLAKEFPRLDREKVNYRIPEPNGFGDRRLALTEEALVDLKSPVPNAKIYYTINGTDPNEGSSIYENPFVLDVAPNQTVKLKVRIIVAEDRASPIFVARYARNSKMNVSLN